MSRRSESDIWRISSGVIPSGNAAFREQAVDMGVPFKGAAEGMEDQDKSRGKVHSVIHLVEEVQYDLTDSFEERVEKGAVFLEVMP